MPLRLHQIVKDQFDVLFFAVQNFEGAVYRGVNLLSTPWLKKVLIFSEPNTLGLFRPLETIGIEPTTSALQGQRSPS